MRAKVQQSPPLPQRWERGGGEGNIFEHTRCMLKPAGSFVLNIKECVVNGERHKLNLYTCVEERASYDP